MEYIYLFFGNIVLLAIFQWLIANWLKIRLENSIKNEYDKELEKYRQLLSRREKAEKIAALFARWIKYGPHPENILERKELFDYKEDLTRMSLELSLWIEDENLLRRIMERLANNPEAANIKDIILETRELMLGRKTEFFRSNEIVIWPGRLDGKTPE